MAVSWRTQLWPVPSRTHFFFLLEGTDVFLCIACSAMRAPSVQKSFFFHVFWLLTDGILHRWGALFGRQIGSPKHIHSKTAQNVQREKRMPNLSIPLSLVRRRVEIADDCSTRVALLKICAFSRNRSKSQQKCLMFRIGKMNQNIARSALWTFFCRRPKAPK